MSLWGLVPSPSPECPKQDQDIVFLIDGSGSISSSDFNKMLNFVKAVMSQFQRPSSQVGSQGSEGWGVACGRSLEVTLPRPDPQRCVVLPVLPGAVLHQDQATLHLQRLRYQLRPTKPPEFRPADARVDIHGLSHPIGHVSPDFPGPPPKAYESSFRAPSVSVRKGEVGTEIQSVVS